MTLTSQAASNLSAQLWRYFDIDGDCDTTIMRCWDGDVYRVYYNTDKGVNHCHVKMRIHEHCIEDLELMTADGPIKPTTTLAEQSQR